MPVIHLKHPRFVVLFIIAICVHMGSSNGLAEGKQRSVTDKRTERAIRLLKGEKVAPGEEEWQTTCNRYANMPFPISDKPTPQIAASLVNCDSYSLYYGFGKPSDPLKARFCAYDEMEKAREDGPFSGTGMLMTIYANGVGAKRNLPLAIKFACRFGGAPAEIEERIAHLDRLRKQNWRGTDFSLCDDITSGLMQGYCAYHFENFEKNKHSTLLKEIQAKWTEAEKADYVVLRKAAERYINSSTESEVDESGTARVAIAIEQEAALENEFVSLLQDLQRGKLPSYSQEKFNAADSKLNALYRRVQKSSDSELWGTVAKEGIKRTQREWLRYRDAWVTFSRKKFPHVNSNAIKTRLTEFRIEKLRLFE